MAGVPTGLKTALRSGSHVYMAVGDSKYAGIEIPVASILVEQAPEFSFNIVRTISIDESVTSTRWAK